MYHRGSKEPGCRRVYKKRKVESRGRAQTEEKLVGLGGVVVVDVDEEEETMFVEEKGEKIRERVARRKSYDGGALSVRSSGVTQTQ